MRTSTSKHSKLVELQMQQLFVIVVKSRINFVWDECLLLARPPNEYEAIVKQQANFCPPNNCGLSILLFIQNACDVRKVCRLAHEILCYFYPMFFYFTVLLCKHRVSKNFVTLFTPCRKVPSVDIRITTGQISSAGTLQFSSFKLCSVLLLYA